MTGWLPPIDDIIDAADARGVPVVVDAAEPHPTAPFLPGPTTSRSAVTSSTHLSAPEP